MGDQRWVAGQPRGARRLRQLHAAAARAVQRHAAAGRQSPTANKLKTCGSLHLQAQLAAQGDGQIYHFALPRPSPLCSCDSHCPRLGSCSALPQAQLAAQEDRERSGRGRVILLPTVRCRGLALQLLASVCGCVVIESGSCGSLAAPAVVRHT